MKCVTHLCICLVFSSWNSNSFVSSEHEHRDVQSYSVTSGIYNDSAKECKCDEEHTCVRKCCEKGYVLTLDEMCVFNDSIELQVPVFKFGNVVSDKDPHNSVLVAGWMPCALDDSKFYTVQSYQFFYLQENCQLWAGGGINRQFDYNRYCFDFVDRLELAVHVCLRGDEMDSYFTLQHISFIGKVISLPFLLITFLIYAVLPLRNFHGKCLMCYVFSLFGAYLAYVYYVYCIYHDYEFTIAECRAFAMIYVYCFVASFFWTNVMYVDIWLTFSGSRGLPSSRKTKQQRQFLLYSGYAWGLPILLVLLILGISKIAKPHTWYNPGLVDNQCWLNDGIPMLLYFYLPKAILVVVNVILFTITASKIKQTQNITAILRQDDNRRSRREDDKQRFKIYVKLFLAMGVNWTVDIASWAISWQVQNVPYATWYVADFFNAAFGAFIFFTFVFKRSVWRLLKQKFCSRSNRPKSHTSKPLSTTHF